MNDLFKCKDCGASRAYITQYCPECGSTGPHTPARKKAAHARLPGRRVDAKTPWVEEDSTRKKASFKEHKKNEHMTRMEAADDRDMRSLFSEEASHKPANKKTSRYITAVVIILACGVLALNFGEIIKAGNQVSAWISPHPAAPQPAQASPDPLTPAVNVTTATGDGSQATNTGTQTGTIPPVKGISTPPEPVKDTTRPLLVEKPVAIPSDSSVTIAWKTDEKSTTQVKYGTDISYPFPSPENTKKDTDHSVYIDGLSPDTTYHFQIISTDSAGNTLMSGDYVFKTESRTDEAPYMGNKAPGFTLKNADGNNISLNQFRGKKLILNFWASWCTACKVELPHLQAIWDKYRNSSEITILTVVSSDSPRNAIVDYMNTAKLDFPVCFDVADATFNKYRLISIPRTYFIDEGGVIRRIQEGMFTGPGDIEFMLSSY